MMNDEVGWGRSWAKSLVRSNLLVSAGFPAGFDCMGTPPINTQLQFWSLPTYVLGRS
jgi:hypothetical protein